MLKILQKCCKSTHPILFMLFWEKNVCFLTFFLDIIELFLLLKHVYIHFKNKAWAVKSSWYYKQTKQFENTVFTMLGQIRSFKDPCLYWQHWQWQHQMIYRSSSALNWTVILLSWISIGICMLFNMHCMGVTNIVSIHITR